MKANNFRTSLAAEKSPQSIAHGDKILTIGSCFSDVIGSYLSKYKFDVLSNPFGTVYNPVSILNYLSDFEFIESHFTESNDSYFHFDAHSKFNAKDQSTLSSLLNIQQNEFANYLESANWLVLTFGTAFTYIYNSSQKIVANCHKVPQKEFTKRLLSVEEINEFFGLSLKFLKWKNPDLKVLLTVSPVRHTKDGIEENSISKSTLRLFCHEATTKYDSVFYFPSYEIMMDDLRDYRFYKEDMIHPNKVAEDYIWNFFQQTFCSEETNEIIKAWDKILSAKNHKPFNAFSSSHQKFLMNTLENLEGFSSKFDISKERVYFQSQLE